MTTKDLLFKFEQKQQSTFKDMGLDFISNGNYDSYSRSRKKNKVSGMRKKGDSIEIFTAENNKYGEFIKAAKINQPRSKKERIDLIRALRKRGITQIEIAEAIGISQPRISQIQNAQ